MERETISSFDLIDEPNNLMEKPYLQNKSCLGVVQK